MLYLYLLSEDEEKDNAEEILEAEEEKEGEELDERRKRGLRSMKKRNSLHYAMSCHLLCFECVMCISKT